MLYPALSQPLVFLYLFLAGFAGGIIYEISLALAKIFKSNIFKQLLLFISTVLCGVIFWIVNLHVNYGQFRFYALLTFICAIILERILVGKFFAILFQKCYNAFNGRKQKKKID